MKGAQDLFLERYGKLTDIQRLAMPKVGQGGNCLIIAPTGSGKTEAVILPLLDRIAEKKLQGIAVIYITPLRALNRDMMKRMEDLCKELGITLAVRHGDTSQYERTRQAKRAPQVLITTPETLQSILITKSFSAALSHVSAIVIDEINELHGSKRGAQLAVAMERLGRKAPFQRIGISATIGDPKSMAEFLSPNSGCEVVSSVTEKKLNISVSLPSGAHGLPPKAIEKFDLDAESTARLSAIISSVKKSKSCLIFANTRQMVEAIGSKLTFIDRIAPFGGIGVHHGSLNKEERVAIEDAFKEGNIRSVIATSSLELGIDIGSVDLVVQYGSPRQAVRMVQRVGRSGHSIARESNGIVIATGPLDAMESLALRSNARAGRLERQRPQEALDVLMHQTCGILLESGTSSIPDVYNLIRKASPYSDLSMQEFMHVVEFMQEQHLAAVNGDAMRAAPQARLFYYGHVSFIPDSKRFLVRDFNTNRIIGSIDDRFVSSSIEEGSVFITRGLPWHVISVEEESVVVEPSSDFEAAIPDWTGEDIPVDRLTAERVFSMFSEPSLEGVPDENTRKKVSEFVESQNRLFRIDGESLVMEETPEYRIIYSCLGSLGNAALARIMAYFLSAKLGRSVTVRHSPYSILLEVHENVDLFEYLKSINPSNARTLLENSIIKSDVFYQRFSTNARFFGLIDKGSAVHKHTIRRMARILKGSPVEKETLRDLVQGNFDVESLVSFLQGIRAGRITIKRVRSDKLCPFGDEILNSMHYARELVLPVSPSSVVVDSFMRNTLGKKTHLICTYCGFKFARGVSELKKAGTLKCPDCGSTMLSRYSVQRDSTISRKLTGKKLSESDKKSTKEMMAEASLFNSYGWRAAAALATYGIGVKTAARALMMLHREDRGFFYEIMEEQKRFIRTKKYWSE